MLDRRHRAPADPDRADWPFIHNGAITLFWRKQILHEAQDTLEALHYEIVDVSCESDESFCAGLMNATRWSEQFGYGPWGGNLDALNDGIASMPFLPSGRKAICFEDFDRQVGRGRERACTVLNIIETQARRHLLRGCLLVALVQTKSARFSTGPLGARQAWWNQKEWLDKKRGL